MKLKKGEFYYIHHIRRYGFNGNDSIFGKVITGMDKDGFFKVQKYWSCMPTEQSGWKERFMTDDISIINKKIIGVARKRSRFSFKIMRHDHDMDDPPEPPKQSFLGRIFRR